MCHSPLICVLLALMLSRRQLTARGIYHHSTTNLQAVRVSAAPPSVAAAQTTDSEARCPVACSVSTVYRGICSATGLSVIIKCYVKAKMKPKNFTRMEREIKLMRSLGDGESLVQLFGVFETDAHKYLVMEHCRGGDLFKFMLMRGGCLPEGWVCLQVGACELSSKLLEVNDLSLSGCGELRQRPLVASEVANDDAVHACLLFFSMPAPRLPMNGSSSVHASVP